MTTQTSTQLLLGLRDPENSHVWSTFHARFFPLLIAFGRRLGLNEHDAQDAAQEALLAFAKAHQEGQYDPAKGRLRTWLFAIATNKIRDLQRHRRREHVANNLTDATAMIDQIPGRSQLSAIWESEWHKALLQACVDAVRPQVSPQSMQAFELTVLRKTPADEVAERLGMSIAAVRKARTRVLARIRKVKTRLES